MPESLQRHIVITLAYGVARYQLKIFEKIKRVAKMEGLIHWGA